MERVSSYEFTLWKMHDKHEPIGVELTHHYFGTLTASVINAVHSTIPKAKGVPRPKPLKASDFHPVRQTDGGDGLTDEQREHLRKKKPRKNK